MCVCVFAVPHIHTQTMKGAITKSHNKLKFRFFPQIDVKNWVSGFVSPQVEVKFSKQIVNINDVSFLEEGGCTVKLGYNELYGTINNCYNRDFVITVKVYVIKTPFGT